MKKILPILLCLTLAAPFVRAQVGYVPAPENLAAREQFADSRFGIFIHWGIYSELANGEWILNNDDLLQKDYRLLADTFNPYKFNAEQWVSIFKSAGAKYITITSRHHDGFSMFGTKASPYNIVDATPFGRDVLKELSEACAKEGMKLHFYYSHLDWGRTDYWPLGNTGHETGRPEGDAGSWGHYVDFMCTQLTELLTNYGPIGCIWFDGVWDKKSGSLEADAENWQLYRQYSLIHRLQPACLVGNNHHHANYPGEDIQIFEKDLPGRNTTGFTDDTTVSESLPLETCETINGSWGYNIRDRRFKSPEMLIQYLVKAAGNGANFLLNVGPRPDGTLPEESVDRLRAIGRWLGKYGETIYATDSGCPEQSWGVTTRADNVLYVHNISGSGAILVPVKGGKIASAVTFDGGEKVAFSQVPEGLVITLPERPEKCPDQIIKVTYKK